MHCRCLRRQGAAIFSKAFFSLGEAGVLCSVVLSPVRLLKMCSTDGSLQRPPAMRTVACETVKATFILLGVLRSLRLPSPPGEPGASGSCSLGSFCSPASCSSSSSVTSSSLSSKEVDAPLHRQPCAHARWPMPGCSVSLLIALRATSLCHADCITMAWGA